MVFRNNSSLTVAGPCRTCTGLPFNALSGSPKLLDRSTAGPRSQHVALLDRESTLRAATVLESAPRTPEVTPERFPDRCWYRSCMDLGVL